MCLIAVLAGCSKTAVVYEAGVATAVTEAPTLRGRESLIQETRDVLTKTCNMVAKGDFLKVDAPTSPDDKSNSKDGTFLKEVKELFDMVENLIDLVPSHSVSISVKCKDNSQDSDEST